MAELFGQRWSRAELERRIGHLSQLGGVRLLASDNGPSRGVRLWTGYPRSKAKATTASRAGAAHMSSTELSR